jgi:hypothetical protein
VIRDLDYGSVVMTSFVPYTAPELFPLAEDVELAQRSLRQSDVYAFAMVCFEVGHVK